MKLEVIHRAVRMAEADMLNSGRGTFADLVEIRQNPLGHPLFRVNGRRSDPVELGLDCQIISGVMERRSGRVFRPVPLFFKNLGGGRPIGDVSMEKQGVPLPVIKPVPRESP